MFSVFCHDDSLKGNFRKKISIRCIESNTSCWSSDIEWGLMANRLLRGSLMTSVSNLWADVIYDEDYRSSVTLFWWCRIIERARIFLSLQLEIVVVSRVNVIWKVNEEIEFLFYIYIYIYMMFVFSDYNVVRYIKSKWKNVYRVNSFSYIIHFFYLRSCLSKETSYDWIIKKACN